jgi:hypothetical protein
LPQKKTIFLEIFILLACFFTVFGNQIFDKIFIYAAGESELEMTKYFLYFVFIVIICLSASIILDIIKYINIGKKNDKSYSDIVEKNRLIANLVRAILIVVFSIIIFILLFRRFLVVN